VLSKHVSARVSSGYVRSHKNVHDGRRTTCVALTDVGRSALRDHVMALRELIDVVD
jgi:DNA-binding MarR family transcriptional regulator